MNDTPYTCEDCGFQFGVIWCPDAISPTYEEQVGFCPRCGADELFIPEDEDAEDV